MLKKITFALISSSFLVVPYHASAQTVQASIIYQSDWTQGADSSLTLSASSARGTLRQGFSTSLTSGHLSGPNALSTEMFERFPGFGYGVTTTDFPLSTFPAGSYEFSSDDLPNAAYTMMGLGSGILFSPVTITNAATFSAWDGRSPLTIHWTSVTGLDPEESDITVVINREGADPATAAVGGLPTTATTFTTDADIFPVVSDPSAYTYSIAIEVDFATSENYSGYANPFVGTNRATTSTAYNFTIVPEPTTWGMLTAGILLMACLLKSRRASKRIL